MKTLVRLSLVMAILTTSCHSTETLRVSIRDASGKPIPDAVFYAEAYDSSGAFDFAWARAAADGEIPPIPIQWKTGAKLAMAAFAPGKRPIALYDELGRLKADGIVLPLENVPLNGLRWEPRLGKLSFPFEGQPSLSQRLAKPEYARLRQAFREAYSLIGSQVLPAERAKIDALNRFERP